MAAFLKNHVCSCSSSSVLLWEHAHRRRPSSVVAFIMDGIDLPTIVAAGHGTGPAQIAWVDGDGDTGLGPQVAKQRGSLSVDGENEHKTS